MALCEHKTHHSEWVETDEGEELSHFTRWTFEDMAPGAFKCSQCGHVGFYTGLWREFYTKGVPCSCSDMVPAIDVERVRHAHLLYLARQVMIKHRPVLEALGRR